MPDSLENGSREKRLAAVGSVASAVVLVSLKVFLTVATGSLGVLSEALHSILDFVAAVITYLSVRVADKPADADHLYGHGKIESFSAFLETGLLVVTALYIIWEAFRRLIFQTGHIRPSASAIGILVVCMGIDLVRGRALKRVARKYPSEALEADALHFSTDVWSTFVVLLGITGAWLGNRLGLAWLGMLDAVAALGVAGVIIWIGSRLGRRTVEALLDVAPSGLRERIASAVAETAGVLDTERVRVRRSGQRYFVDVTISVPRTASLEQAHAASDAVERSVARIVPADVVVHVEPRAPRDEPLFETIRAIAQGRGRPPLSMVSQFDQIMERMGGRSEWTGRVGTRVLPASVNLVDDPTLKDFQGQPLLGGYEVDDEGVRGQRASIVENGILKNQLMSRRPGPDFEASNGHGRSALLSETKPLASNLFFQSSGALAAGDLRKKFLDSCREDGHEWCLEVKRMDNPALSSLRQEDFSDFLGEMAGGIATGERMPLLVYRVYVSDGHEELVRGGILEGLTLRSLRNILGIGSDAVVYTYMQNPADGFAGTALGSFGSAQGGIPSTVIAPALLLEEAEIRGFHGEPRRLPAVPAPPLSVDRAGVMTPTR